MLRRLALFLCLFLAAPAAYAHPAPFSYLDLHVRQDRIDGSLVVHVFDAAHDLGVAVPEQLLAPGVLASHRQALIALLAPRLHLDAGAPVQVAWGIAEAMPARNGIRLSFRAERPPGGALGVRTDFFPYDRYHQTFVNLYEGDTLKAQWIFGAGSAERTYYRGTAAGALAVMATFIPAGIHHILIGPDHLLFLLGLLLLGGSWGVLVRIVTAFTIGHSITLSLAALGIVTPPSSVIEPAIALTIVLVGVDNLIRGQGRDLRVWGALFFGLVHGFGFASVLREFGLPREALLLSLFSFNLGVELGQLLVVVPLALALRAIWRWRPKLGKQVAVAGSTAVIAAGGFWFVQRIIFPGGA